MSPPPPTSDPGVAPRDHDASSSGAEVFSSVRTELDFPRDEAAVLAFWERENIFAKTLSADTRHTGPRRGTWVFYEGPPTANGLPHNGHVLTRAIKDLLPRFKTMQGYDVPRQAGWDTHGLPVEVEVEKELGIHGKADIQAYGMKPFIARCIESVFRYTEAWEENTKKLGYWVDLDAAYVTYHQSYVESVWWALGELHRKGLLYRGHKVVWWWPQGGTALSSGEVGQGYKTVDDPSCYVAFELVDEPGTYLCAWTTTPWTLPSNGYTAVRDTFHYDVCRWRDGKRIIVASDLRKTLAGKMKLELEVERTLTGRELVGRRYRPCFDAFAGDLWDQTATRRDGTEVSVYWRVLAADFVTLDAGTGIVHLAPAFGEDDNLAHNAELKTYQNPAAVPLICAVHPDGTMTEETGAFAGTYVKDADKAIVADLRARGHLVHFESYRHEYPFCWRAMEDPLIQLARPAWFIRTTERIDEAIENNQHVHWVPDHIKDGRFGDFLRNNVDWALSRERFWGTPLNVWVSDNCGYEFAPRSVAEIEAHNPDAFAHFHAARAEDPSLNEHLMVHKPWIDEVTLTCPKCGDPMRRVPEVIDCWFDSGCMPFAQLGFPHREGSHDLFVERFPADFISEAIDQTRGWFYSLLMISTLVFDDETCRAMDLPEAGFPRPYKSCVVLGHVGDREGRKESKSRGNYTPPDIILDRVRMEFAVVPRDDADLATCRDKDGKQRAIDAIRPRDELTVHIGRDDYEGLDLSGNGAQVRVYPADDEAASRTLRVEPVSGLPRRTVVMAASLLAELGRARAPWGVKPAGVPRLDPTQRLVLEDPSRPAPGADAFRWFFYASSPPWNNTRHSLTNVRLVQKDFIIKLRNVYSFFVIYARIDGFNPAAAKPEADTVTSEVLASAEGHRPVSMRSRLDRWIVSEVHLATEVVTARLEALDIYGAALRLVALVDALSNWYVRRSRGRFWASVTDPAARQDKRDASFTLYETLVTMTRLIAPFVPFFAEEMYQNLVRGPWPRTQPESVHLVSFPVVDRALVDTSLSEDMEAVRELVSLGLQVRTDNTLRVRQPLRRADVIVTSAAQMERLRPYADLIIDELNVKTLHWLLPGDEAEEVSYQLKPNFRALGPRLGKRVQAVKKALAAADAGALRAELASRGEVALPVEGETIVLSRDEVQVAVVAAEGFAAAGGRAGVVVLHTGLDEALIDEGLAREVLARIQNARKEMSLEFTDRIELTLRGSERVRRVLTAARDHIAQESLCATLTVEPSDSAPADEPGWSTVEVGGERLSFRVARAG
ncbi:MAG: isoleucine--tRNA ligase [Myxococcota bacterium]